MVEVHQAFVSSTIEFRRVTEVAATSRVGHPGLGHRPRAAAEPAALTRVRGPHLSIVVPNETPAAFPLRLGTEGDVDGEVRDLTRYRSTVHSRDQLPL